MELKLGQIIKFKSKGQVKKGKLIRFFSYGDFPIYIKLSHQPNVWVHKIDFIKILSPIKNKLK
jgi:hypothetical protein